MLEEPMVEPFEKKIEIRRFKYIAQNVRGNKVLDIGCRDAKVLDFLGKVDYTGIDINKELNDKLNKRGIKAITLDVSKKRLPFKSGTYDTVVTGEVIEHLANPYFALKEALRVLKKGGMLVGTTANTFNIQSLLYSMLPKSGSIKTATGHIYAFGEEELANLLKMVGFRDVRVKKICARVPLLQMSLPDSGIFKIFSPFFLFVAKK